MTETSPSSVVTSDNQARFGSLAIPEDFAALLKECGYKKPMPVQENAMRKIAEGDSLVIHSATGSGKTLAFLVPLLAPIQPEDGLRVVIVAPSQELAIQLTAEAAQLLPSEDASKPRVLLTISSTREVELEQMDKIFASPQPPQVLVGTPQRLLRIAGHPRASSIMKRLQTVVFDEADLMISALAAPGPRYKGAPPDQRAGAGRRLAEQKPKPAERLFERIRDLRSKSAPPLQVISCSATITSDVRRKLGTMIGGKGKSAAGTVVTAGPLHPTSKKLKKFGVAGVQLPNTLKHLAYIGENLETMMQVAVAEDDSRGQTLVVLPNGKSIQNEIKRFRKIGLSAIALQQALGVPKETSNDKERARPKKGEALQDTMLNKRSDLVAASVRGKWSDDSDKPLPMIVTNEHSARGMDLKGITLVIVMGLPRELESYIHVVGRTAREGRKGNVKYMLTEYEDCERLDSFRKMLGVHIEEVDCRFL